jgi:hypothetical protein
MKYRDSLLKATLGFALCALPLAATGCLPSLNDPDYGPLTSQFVVSDIFSPSGFMGDGATPGYMTVDFDVAHCKQPRPPGAQGYCYSFTYFMDPTHNLDWAGAYWVFPTNSWGAYPGYAIQSQNFQQVRFWAAIDMPTPATAAGGGTTFFNGIAGGIDGNGFYGPNCTNGPRDFSRCTHVDKVRAQEVYEIGKDIGPDFKQFHISLAGQPATDELVGAFAWSMNFPSDSCTCSIPGLSRNECLAMNGTTNCATPVKVYIDDIVWDTAPPPTP